MKKISSIQEFQGWLSIGYLYLIVMGILNETLYYYQVGIDILTYSSVLDVLIKPITKLTYSIPGFSFFLFLAILPFVLPKFFAKNRNKKWAKKSFKIDPNLTDKEAENAFFSVFVLILFLGLFGFFIGTGVGGGMKISEKIEKNEVTYDDQLTFKGGTTADVKIIGKNSSFIFYLTEESQTVKVSPINGAIQSIEEIK